MYIYNTPFVTFDSASYTPIHPVLSYRVSHLQFRHRVIFFLFSLLVYFYVGLAPVLSPSLQHHFYSLNNLFFLIHPCFNSLSSNIHPVVCFLSFPFTSLPALIVSNVTHSYTIIPLTLIHLPYFPTSLVYILFSFPSHLNRSLQFSFSLHFVALP